MPLLRQRVNIVLIRRRGGEPRRGDGWRGSVRNGCGRAPTRGCKVFKEDRNMHLIGRKGKNEDEDASAATYTPCIN